MLQFQQLHGSIIHSDYNNLDIPTTIMFDGFFGCAHAIGHNPFSSRTVFNTFKAEFVAGTPPYMQV